MFDENDGKCVKNWYVSQLAKEFLGCRRRLRALMSNDAALIVPVRHALRIRVVLEKGASSGRSRSVKRGSAGRILWVKDEWIQTAVGERQEKTTAGELFRYQVFVVFRLG